MVQQKKWVILGSVLALILFLVSQSVFIVNEPEQALILQFGELKEVHQEPGLKVKVPFIQEVVKYEKRLFHYEYSAFEITAKDQKRFIVDTYAVLKIINPLRFYKTVKSEHIAGERIASVVDKTLRGVIGNVNLSDAITHKRAETMDQIVTLVNRSTEAFGLKVEDVKIRRTDLPSENSQSIFGRMTAEREREAREWRAKGQEEALRIKSDAEREREVIIAQARRDAEIIRGEGDKKAAQIMNASIREDLKFYNFYRSLKAYEATLAQEDTYYVLSPKSEFFTYFNKSSEK